MNRFESKARQSYRELLKEAKALGAEVIEFAQTRKKHLRLTLRKGSRQKHFILSGTPSCPRAGKNAAADIRRWARNKEAT